MPILTTDFVWRGSALTSDDTPAQNGGRMTSTVKASGVKNNLFPNASQAERTAGSVKLRKVFIHIASTLNIELLDARVFISQLTPADDFVTIHPGTATDTQDTFTGRAYGVGTLLLGVSADDTAIQVVGENMTAYATLEPFQVGDMIRLAKVVDGSEVVEWGVIDTVTYEVGSIDIGLEAALVNDFPQEGTLVSSCIQEASVVAAIDSLTVTSTAGTLNSEGVIANNKGAIDDSITLEFTSASAFTATGVIAGSLGTGSRFATFSPINTGTGSPYITIPSTAWGGVFEVGDTVTFDVTPAAIPVWYRREIPAGASSLNNDSVAVSIFGESA